MGKNETDKREKKDISIPDRIITIARRQGINLLDDPELLEILRKINPEKKIPEEVYSLLAEIVVEVYKLRDQWKSKP
ncbi:hypothetical protein ACFL5L_06585 [candidate division KSB1 bacterium]